MNYPDPLPIHPWTQPCSGEVSLPGSKSLTNRALILAALSPGPVALCGALFSRDSNILATALSRLGFNVTANQQKAIFSVAGSNGQIPNDRASIHVGNAGTAARFLTALVCLHPSGCYDFDGDAEMRNRPMDGLIRALENLGVRFTFQGQPYCFPFRVQTAGLPGGNWSVDATASSQMLSALMLVAPFAAATVEINCGSVRPAFVNMTAGMMRQFGVNIEGDAANHFRIQPQSLVPPNHGFVEIEPDVTAASYFIALPYVTGGHLQIRGLRKNMLQGDLAFAGVMQSHGLQIIEAEWGWRISYHPRVAPPANTFLSFQTFSDTFLTYAALAPLFPVPITITGIGHTRFQETDRIHAMATELGRLGAHAMPTEDSLAITPFASPHFPSDQPVTVATYHDHRVAMSFAILGCANRAQANRPWIQIADPACCGKTFPEFFKVLQNLYQYCHG